MIMKKVVLISVLMMILCFMTACGSGTNTDLRKATGLDEEQCRYIDEVLEDFGFSYDLVSTSDNKLLKGMDKAYKGYDLRNNNGETYLLIARKDGEDFVAILDSRGELVDGVIDTEVLPSWFKRN